MNPFITQLPSRRIFIGAAALGMILLVAALMTIFLFDPSRHAFYPKCLLHSLTGLNCAGCGSLRALHHLLHGEFLPAFRSNALLIGALLPAGWIGIRWLRGESPAALLRKWFSHPMPTLVFLGIAIIFSVLRNLPGSTFAWMNP